MQIYVYRLLGKQICPNERYQGLCGLGDFVRHRHHKTAQAGQTHANLFLRFSCIEIVTTRIRH